jgi:hypothetical protein
VFESAAQDLPFVLELKVRLQPVKTENNSEKEKVDDKKEGGYILKIARTKKYKRPFFYQISQEEIRLFLFDKMDYSVDEFGKCMSANRPKDDSDNNFFGKLIEGLVFDSDSNALSIDFIEKFRLAKYYKGATSAREKELISKVFDDRKIEVAMRESVANMEEYERVSFEFVDNLFVCGVNVVVL